MNTEDILADPESKKHIEALASEIKDVKFPVKPLFTKIDC